MYKYTTFIQNDTIPTGYPMAGAIVTQGFNDKTTNHKGHLGYDLSCSTAKALFDGTVVGVVTNNASANGRVVCLEHTIGACVFYTAYCHLAQVNVSVGDTVSANTTVGIVGGSGYGSNSHYATHLHVCAFTGGPSSNPMGYCGGGTKTFEQTSVYANAYYYGPDTTQFPGCGGLCFYDPYGVVSSKASVITTYP